MRRIIDTKYKKSNLNKVMTKQYQHLNNEERKRLMILLNKFKYMFDGTLGTWNTTPVDLKLKDNAKPACLLPYPLPRVHEEMFRKEV